MKLDRRKFIGSAVGASAAGLLGNIPGALASTGQPKVLPARAGDCGIEHVVVLMMENRSFDHLLGWLPNADGVQDGLIYYDLDGQAHATHALAPDFTGFGHPDPDHSYGGGRVQYNDGHIDGFLRSGSNDDYAIGYYVEEDRPFCNALARNYTTLDQCFCSILGPTFSNRLFLHAAQTDRLENTLTLSTLPTIWDQLAAARVSHAYYFSNLPFLALWGDQYLGISRPYAQFLVEAALGRLPAVSFVDPRFTLNDEDANGNDDHPHADVRAGDAFLRDTFLAVARGPRWPNTVFVVTYDEWGGFFDHVVPPRAAAPNEVDTDVVDGKALLGFRVPAVVASPFSRGDADSPRVSHSLFDHASILKLIEWRWGLPTLTDRDASCDIENLNVVLDCENCDAELPDLPDPIAPAPMPSLQPGLPTSALPSSSGNAWSRFRESGLLAGWELPQM